MGKGVVIVENPLRQINASDAVKQAFCLYDKESIIFFFLDNNLVNLDKHLIVNQ